jgi:N6-L-threonylcarbamoyladenine synthase
MIILGIESSCDETACGIISDDFTVLSNELYSQIQEHSAFGGVVPEIAARAHLEKIQPIVQASLGKAGVGVSQITHVAYTRGPGLMGPLLVGASFARGLAKDLQVPAIGINHLEGHIAAVHISHPTLKPPYVCLTVSGGHTELTYIPQPFVYEVLGRTRDDAAGEAFDKCGKLLGLGYPAGPIVSELAAKGNPKFFAFPKALREKNNFEFSFSGLKTAVLRYTQTHDSAYIQANLHDICASLQGAIVDILAEKSMQALRHTQCNQLIVCGGVSANPCLRHTLEQLCTKKNARCYYPHPQYCTDNGAMIAAAAYLRLQHNQLPEQSAVTPYLPL